MTLNFFFKEEDINSTLKWKNLSKVLSIPLEKIFYEIKLNKNKHFIYLARKISFELAKKIKDLNIPGIYLINDYKRYYPLGKLTSQLVGFTNIDNEGIEGVEKSFDKLLTGKPETIKVRIDKNGKVIEKYTIKKSIPPNDITLSIDSRYQKIVYCALNNAVISNKANSGSAVLINIETGEILSIVNSPSFDPNNSKQLFKENPTIRNKAITDMFELGSTVKPMIIMKALEKKIATPNTIMNISPITINKHTIKDVFPCHGKLSITDILKKSSNIGVSKLSLLMPMSEIIDIYAKFKLGKSTNIGLIGEKSGFLYSKNKHFSDLDKVSLSFGYGVMATPLQLARVYTIIGRNGSSQPLSIIAKDYQKIKNNSTEQVFSKKIIKIVSKMLETVTQPGGAGRKAAIKGYRIAAKTGTTKKLNSKKHYVKKYISYIAGIVPMSHPKFSLIIMINEPKSKKYYGGDVSAPVFKIIMSQILKLNNILPDNLQKY